MTLTCCIIDDEPLAVRLLESYVSKTPNLTLSRSFNSAVEAIDFLASHPVDLIFCDIQMPDLNGLQFAEIIKSLPTRIVFTTAFSEYALDGWKVDALHYLLKPISYVDFLSASNKAKQWFERGNTRDIETTEAPADDAADFSSIDDDGLGQSPIAGDCMFVKSDYKLVKIRFKDILYIEGLKDYVKIYVQGERRPILSLTSMRAVEAALPTSCFQRTHRSFIVNMEQIEIIEKGQIVFGEKKIPISDSYKDIVQEYIASCTLQGRKV